MSKLHIWSFYGEIMLQEARTSCYSLVVFTLEYIRPSLKLLSLVLFKARSAHQSSFS